MTKATKEFDVARHFDESLAAKYDRRIRQFCPNYDALHRMLIPWLQGLPAAADFLSVGAGTGAEVVTLGKIFPRWRFVAVDVSPDMIKACQARATDAGLADRVACFTGRLQDYASSASFDAVSSVFVSHFIKGRAEKLSYFKSISENLKVGGLLVVADLFGEKGSAEFTALLDAWLRSYAMHGVSDEDLIQDRLHVEKDVDFIPEDDLFTLLHEAGFSTPIRFYQTYLFGGWVATRVH
ncbi:MAG: SAM-dependent methyltransferase [Solidesulfovibrio sp. DCME]|uniref:SAM-dependent methyltransferase n=1 Tax=Solidesulfovibrio sp. DCME TaxID=3447380 RepID=UPI003D0D111F